MQIEHQTIEHPSPDTVVLGGRTLWQNMQKNADPHPDVMPRCRLT